MSKRIAKSSVLAELIQGGRVKLMVALEAILLNHDRRDIERREDDRVLGSIIQVPKFAIGVATLAVFFVLALTVTFYRGSKETRDTLTFFVLAGALAGGGVGAFYVWAGVKTAIRQRQQTATENRIQFALQFLTRWNDPDMREFHHKWRQLTEEIEQNAGGIVPVIKEDFEKRTLVANALNFFEEIGYAARVGAADLEALRSVIGALSLKYFKITRPWIEYRRETDHIPTAWSNYEWLCDRWKNS